MEFELDVSKLIGNHTEKQNEIVRQITVYASHKAYKDAMEEVEKLYHDIITLYYKYRTMRYIRHGESKSGTMKGSNLYNSFHCDTRYNRDGSQDSVLQINGSEMDDYTNIKGDETIDADFVLDRILEGTRPMPPWIRPDMEFRVSISNQKLGNFEGTIDEIFSNQINRAFNAYKQQLYDKYCVELAQEYLFK